MPKHFFSRDNSTCRAIYARDVNINELLFLTLYGSTAFHRTDKVTKGTDGPPHRIRRRIAKHFDKERRQDTLGLGIGFGATATEEVGLVEYLDDAALFGKRREGDFEFFNVFAQDTFDYSTLLNVYEILRFLPNRSGYEISIRSLFQYNARQILAYGDVCACYGNLANTRARYK